MFFITESMGGGVFLDTPVFDVCGIRRPTKLSVNQFLLALRAIYLTSNTQS